MKCLRSSKWSCNLMFYLLISPMCWPETLFYLFIFFIFSSLRIYLPGTLGQVGGQDLQRWNAWDKFKDPWAGHTCGMWITHLKKNIENHLFTGRYSSTAFLPVTRTTPRLEPQSRRCPNIIYGVLPFLARLNLHQHHQLRFLFLQEEQHNPIMLPQHHRIPLCTWVGGLLFEG